MSDTEKEIKSIEYTKYFSRKYLLLLRTHFCTRNTRAIAVQETIQLLFHAGDVDLLGKKKLL